MPFPTRKNFLNYYQLPLSLWWSILNWLTIWEIVATIYTIDSPSFVIYFERNIRSSFLGSWTWHVRPIHSNLHPIHFFPIVGTVFESAIGIAIGHVAKKIDDVNSFVFDPFAFLFHLTVRRNIIRFNGLPLRGRKEYKNLFICTYDSQYCNYIYLLHWLGHTFHLSISDFTSFYRNNPRDFIPKRQNNSFPEVPPFDLMVWIASGFQDYFNWCKNTKHNLLTRYELNLKGRIYLPDWILYHYQCIQLDEISLENKDELKHAIHLRYYFCALPFFKANLLNASDIGEFIENEENDKQQKEVYEYFAPYMKINMLPHLIHLRISSPLILYLFFAKVYTLTELCDCGHSSSDYVSFFIQVIQHQNDERFPDYFFEQWFYLLAIEFETLKSSPLEIDSQMKKLWKLLRSNLSYLPYIPLETRDSSSGWIQSIYYNLRTSFVYHLVCRTKKRKTLK